MNTSDLRKVKEGLLARLSDLACRDFVLLRGIRIRRILLRLQALEKVSR